MKMLIYLVLALVAALLIYIRAAPSDAATWHVVPKVTEDKTGVGSAARIVHSGPDGLAKLDQIARATPRTTVLAGSVGEGMVTYVTRTAAIGFPDYTTVQQDGDTLKIYARLRFGKSDFGVNAKRVDGWLADLKG